jgi:hypothetical protein
MKACIGFIVILTVAACDVTTTAPASLGTPSFAAIVEHTNEFTEGDFGFFEVPCANGGAGEIVRVSGTLHLLMHVTITPAGRTLLRGLGQAQGMIGVGETTGDVYRSSIASGFVDARFDDAFPIAFTELVNIRLIGPGPDNNLMLHETFHLTVNADGSIIAETFNRNLTCD